MISFKVRQVQELEELRCRNKYLRETMAKPSKKQKIFDKNEFDIILNELGNNVIDFRKKYPPDSFKLKTVEIVPEDKDECMKICTEIENDIKTLIKTKTEIGKAMKEMTNKMTVLKIKKEA